MLKTHRGLFKTGFNNGHPNSEPGGATSGLSARRDSSDNSKNSDGKKVLCYLGGSGENKEMKKTTLNNHRCVFNNHDGF